MSPIVRVVGGEPDEIEIFISIEDVPVVLADLRRRLPELTDELRKQWPVERVAIRERSPRRRNPSVALQFIPQAYFGIVVTLGHAILAGIGAEVGRKILKSAQVKRISQSVRKWVKAQFRKRKPARSLSRASRQSHRKRAGK
jgi:hypothetical protein